MVNGNIAIVIVLVVQVFQAFRCLINNRYETEHAALASDSDNYQKKTKQAALAKNSAARMTYMTSIKTCMG